MSLSNVRHIIIIKMAKLKPKQMFTVAGRTYTATRVNHRYKPCDVCMRTNITRPCQVAVDCTTILRNDCYPKATNR
jgi:hypothetical protein